MKNLGKISTLLVVVALAGCNTMHGLGKDLSAGGNALATAADKVKNGSNQSNTNEKVKAADVKESAFQAKIAKGKK